MAETLTKLCEEIGIPDGTRDYLLVGLNIKLPEVITKMAKTDDLFANTVVTSLKEGVTLKGQEYKLTEEDFGPVLEAMLATLYDQCVQEAAKKAEAARPKPPELPSPPVIQYTLPTDPSKSKAPKTLGPGVWNQKIEAYEKEWQGRRKFPYQVIVGAEEVLARLVWELEGSKNFTPLKLGEIVAARSYSSTGKVNKWANSDKSKDVFQIKAGTTDGVELVQKNWTFTPQTWEMITEAFEAVKWALVFAGYGDDVVVGEWTDRFLLNLKTKKVPAMTKDLYEEACLLLMLKMRVGADFGTASKDILQDKSWWADFATDWVPSERRSGTKRSSDGRNKNVTKACLFWNKGICRRGKDCPFVHEGSAGTPKPSWDWNQPRRDNWSRDRPAWQNKDWKKGGGGKGNPKKGTGTRGKDSYKGGKGNPRG